MNRLRTFRLPTFISSIISIAILITATLLISQTYIYHRRQSLRQAQIHIHQITQRLNQQISSARRQLIQTLKMLSLDPLISLHSLPKQLDRLSILFEALRQNKIANDFYIGYPNGDFLLLRRLNNSSVNALQYRLQVVHHNAQGQIDKAFWQNYNLNKPTQPRQHRPNYQFDPRTRSWYQDAQKTPSVISTKPYRFFTTKELGISLALKTESGAVIATDASFTSLSQWLTQLTSEPQIYMALISNQQQLLGASKHLALNLRQKQTKSLRQKLANTPLVKLITPQASQIPFHQFSYANTQWFGMHKTLTMDHRYHWSLLIAQPESVIMAEAKQQLHQQLLLSLILALILILFGWQAGRHATKALSQLAKQLTAMHTFKFNQRVKLSSRVQEFQELALLINKMAIAIEQFEKISHILAHEEHYESLLAHVVEHLTLLMGAQAGCVYLFNSSRDQLNLAHCVNITPQAHIPVTTEKEKTLIHQIEQHFNDPTSIQIVIPLLSREHQNFGILILKIPHAECHDLDAIRQFVKKISSSVSLAIETQLQLANQEQLINSMVKMLADAIDAKSPYTGEHCKRVPLLSQMLLKSIEETRHGLYADYLLPKSQRKAFHIATWLHDCGKLIIPEYVIDKGSKLETIYNRLHEIRTRFEVLWRDAELLYWHQYIQNPQRRPILQRQLEHRHQELRQQYAIIARLNEGKENVDETDLTQLDQIAQQTWQRHFSNRIGLSPIEANRLDMSQEEQLPAIEPLLSDRPEHLIAWQNNKPAVEKDDPHNIWGFDMSLPHYNYHLGELHNLSIQRGTLTEEERFIINNHIVQTITMLSSLSLPPSMSKVPDWAGNHHEKLDGSGYPRRLNAQQLSIEERIVALADIFEALTACDRPYKQGKTLQQTMEIMADMVEQNYIDAQLFQHFIESGIYNEYARQFLDPQQSDEIDKKYIYKRAKLIP